MRWTVFVFVVADVVRPVSVVCVRVSRCYRSDCRLWRVENCEVLLSVRKICRGDLGSLGKGRFDVVDLVLVYVAACC